MTYVNSCCINLEIHSARHLLRSQLFLLSFGVQTKIPVPWKINVLSCYVTISIMESFGIFIS